MNAPKQYRTHAEYDLPPVPGGPTRRYVICSTPRSGSTLLGRLLEASGHMGVPYEYLNQQVHMRPMAERLGVPPQRVGQYLAAVEQVRTTPNGVYGLKGHFHQIGPLLGNSHVKRLMAGSVLVWIRRRDLLGQALSYYRASATKVWSVTEGSEAPPPVEYERGAIVAGMDQLLAENASWEAWFASQGRPFVTVWYEDLVARPDAVCKRVCRAVLGYAIEHVFEISQADIVKMRDDTTDEWRRRFVDESRAAAARPLRVVPVARPASPARAPARTPARTPAGQP